MKRFASLFGIALVFAAGACSTAAGAVPTIGLNFTATDIFEAGFLPPDSNGAAGPDQVAILINGRYGVYDKTTGAVIEERSLASFWDTYGQGYVNFPFDPRIVYDPNAQRWYATAVDNIREANSVLVAVSTSADLTDGWTGWKMASDATGETWADFPRLGFNAEGVYVTMKMFPVSSASTAHHVLVLPKPDLLAPAPSIASASLLAESMPFATHGPVVDYDNAPGGAAFLWGSPHQVGRRNLTGPITSPTLEWGTTISTVSRPDALDAPQPDPSFQALDAMDSRIHSSAILTGGSFWGIQDVTHDGRSALRWWEIDAATDTVSQEGVIFDPEMYLLYGSIAVNDEGDVVVGFSATGPGAGQEPSAYAVVGTTEAGVTTFSAPLLLKQGTSSYERLDGIGRNRWGDYSATVLDPDDPMVFWTFQEWASGEDAWSLQVTQIIVPEPATFVFLAAGLLVVAIRRRR